MAKKSTQNTVKTVGGSRYTLKSETFEQDTTARIALRQQFIEVLYAAYGSRRDGISFRYYYNAGQHNDVSVTVENGGLVIGCQRFNVYNTRKIARWAGVSPVLLARIQKPTAALAAKAGR